MADMNGLFDQILGTVHGRQGGKTETQRKLERQAARATCSREGHQYRVHGKTAPTRITCARCEVSWAIGPRTEPA